METYRIMDLTKNPNEVVPGKESVTYEEGVAWIDNSGAECPLCDYTLLKNE